MSISLTMLQIVACVATAATTTYLIVDSREKRQFLSGKAEELYTLVEGVDRDLADLFAHSYLLICEGRACQPAHDIAWSKMLQDSSKVRMLVSFYFPSLWTHVKRSDAAVATTIAALQEYKDHHPDENALLRLDHLVLDMKDAFEAFKHAVVVAHHDARGHPFGLRRRDSTPREARALRMAA